MSIIAQNFLNLKNAVFIAVWRASIKEIVKIC